MRYSHSVPYYAALLVFRLSPTVVGITVVDDVGAVQIALRSPSHHHRRQAAVKGVLDQRSITELRSCVKVEVVVLGFPS